MICFTKMHFVCWTPKKCVSNIMGELENSILSTQFWPFPAASPPPHMRPPRRLHPSPHAWPLPQPVHCGTEETQATASSEKFMGLLSFMCSYLFYLIIMYFLKMFFNCFVLLLLFYFPFFKCVCVCVFVHLLGGILLSFKTCFYFLF